MRRRLGRWCTGFLPLPTGVAIEQEEGPQKSLPGGRADDGLYGWGR